MSRRLRIADLVGTPVVDAGGRRLGHVVDLELGRGGDVAAILVGQRGWLSRLHLRQLVKGHFDDRIPWARVERVDPHEVRLRRRGGGGQTR